MELNALSGIEAGRVFGTAPARHRPPLQTPEPAGIVAVEDRVQIRFAPAEDCEDCDSEALEEERNAPNGGIPGTGDANAELTLEEQKVVEQLQARDREVRAHERAHAAAAGGVASGGPTFTYQTGPDGKRYAVGGEVQIDAAPVPNNPEATLRKAQTIRRAANAPADPSSQDRRVAAAASRMEAQARRELREENTREANALQEASGSTRTPASSAPAPTEPQGSDPADAPSSPHSARDSLIARFADNADGSARGQRINIFA